MLSVWLAVGKTGSRQFVTVSLIRGVGQFCESMPCLAGEDSEREVT